MQHRRLDRLRDALDAHAQGLSLAELASALHVSARSVRRYLLELGRQIELESVPVAPGAAHVWRIKPSERGRAVALRRTQAFGLLALRSHLEVLRGSALFDELDVAYRSLRQVAERPGRVTLKGEVSPNAKLEGRFISLSAPAQILSGRGDDIDALFQALAERRYVSAFIKVAEPKSVEAGAAAAAKRLTLAPYALVLFGGTLVVIGLGAGAAIADVWPLASLSKVDVATKTFEVPEDFDVARFDQGFFGLAPPQKCQSVTVEFDAKTPEQVRQKKVHPAQKTAVARDGRFRLTFPAPDLDAVRAWVLSFGPLARAVEPPALVEAVAQDAALAAQRYV